MRDGARSALSEYWHGCRSCFFLGIFPVNIPGKKDIVNPGSQNAGRQGPDGQIQDGILREKKPRFAIYENVKNIVGARFKETFDLFVKELSGCDVRVLGGERLPGVMALFIPGHESEKLIAKLDVQGIQLSGGAACAAGSGEASHVYRAMGLSEREARCVLRISAGRCNTPEDMYQAAQALRRLISA